MTREATQGVAEGRPASGAPEAPPLGSWARAYALVLLNLLVMIALLAWFTRAFE